MDLQARVDLKKAMTQLINYVPFETNLIDLTRPSEEILADMHPRATRYRIRKAERMSDRFDIRRNGEHEKQDFDLLYNRFAKRKNLGRLTRKARQGFAPVSDTFVVYFEGIPVCGHLFLRDVAQSRVGAVLGASVRIEDPSAPIDVLNRYLYWHEIRTYKAEGFRTYDVGGIGEYVPAVAEFKRTLGGRRVLEHSYVLGGLFARLALNSAKALRGISGIVDRLQFRKRRSAPMAC